jgi:hypothetical protein
MVDLSLTVHSPSSRKPLTSPRARFVVFEVDFGADELRKNGLRIRLPEQPFQAPAMLLEKPREVVTGEDLRKRLWSADRIPIGRSTLLQRLPRINLNLLRLFWPLQRQFYEPSIETGSLDRFCSSRLA